MPYSERVKQALDFATEKHKGQKRIGGDDYITHPIAVCEKVKNLGYGEAVQANYEKAAEITKNATEYGKKAGNSAPGIQYITTPICAVGGFLGGVGYFVGDSVADIFRKGQDVYINTGDIMNVKLVNPIDVPVY